MAVEAINGANVQQPQKHSNASSAVAGGVGLGAAGALGGYLLGGKRPTLDQVFDQMPDTFEHAENLDDTQKAAKDKLNAAVEEVQDATATQKAEEEKAKQAVEDSINGQTIDNRAELEKAVTDAKTALENKEVKIGENTFKYGDLEKAVKDAKDKLKAAKPEEKEAAEKALKEATANLDKAKEAAKTELEAFNTAKKNLRDPLVAKFQEASAKEGTNEKKLADALKEATNKLTEAVKTKKDEIFAREDIKKAFESIKKLFPKEGKGRAALIYGGIAAAVGLIGGLLFGGKKGGEEVQKAA